jgi:hypothetical protein
MLQLKSLGVADILDAPQMIPHRPAHRLRYAIRLASCSSMSCVYRKRQSGDHFGLFTF